MAGEMKIKNWYLYRIILVKLPTEVWQRGILGKENSMVKNIAV